VVKVVGVTQFVFMRRWDRRTCIKTETGISILCALCVRHKLLLRIVLLGQQSRPRSLMIAAKKLAF
jgi:hypothetical protein